VAAGALRPYGAERKQAAVGKDDADRAPQNHLWLTHLRQPIDEKRSRAA
jgi:hypothetical protein